MTRQKKIALIGDGFYKWGGGIDFLLTLGRVIEKLMEESHYKAILLLPDEPDILLRLKSLKKYIINNTTKESYKEIYKAYKCKTINIESQFKKYCTQIPIVKYKKIMINSKDLCYSNFLKKLKYLDIDIYFPMINPPSKNSEIPWIGYIYDFQHRYFEEYFFKREREYRNKFFGKMLKSAKFIMVNAKDVKNDINKFYPEYKGEIFVLPFLPFANTNWISEKISEYKSNLPQRYFMISNQFWQHKNHMLAFRALERIYNMGYYDVFLLCSGKMEDNINNKYIEQLKNEISSLNCKGNIQLLGYLEKQRQMDVMHNSIALIQPTQFEGGPGGGSVYDAISIGTACIVSDIKINKEIDEKYNVFFFKNNNEDDLVDKMLLLLNSEKIVKGYNELLDMTKINQRLYADKLNSYIENIMFKNY